MCDKRGRLTVDFSGRRLGHSFEIYFFVRSVFGRSESKGLMCREMEGKGLADDGTRATRAMGRNGQQ
jgi:hypothetical protein